MSLLRIFDSKRLNFAKAFFMDVLFSRTISCYAVKRVAEAHPHAQSWVGLYSREDCGKAAQTSNHLEQTLHRASRSHHGTPVKRLPRETPPTRIVESGAVCHPSGHAQETKSFAFSAASGAQWLSMTEIFSMYGKFRRNQGFHRGGTLSEYPFQHTPMSLK